MTKLKSPEEFVHAWRINNYTPNVSIDARDFERLRELIEQAIRAAERRGEERMRERAAKIADEDFTDNMKWAKGYSAKLQERLAQESMISATSARDIATAIRALGIGDEGASK